MIPLKTTDWSAFPLIINTGISISNAICSNSLKPSMSGMCTSDKTISNSSFFVRKYSNAVTEDVVDVTVVVTMKKRERKSKTKVSCFAQVNVNHHQISLTLFPVKKDRFLSDCVRYAIAHRREPRAREHKKTPFRFRNRPHESETRDARLFRIIRWHLHSREHLFSKIKSRSLFFCEIRSRGGGGRQKKLSAFPRYRATMRTRNVPVYPHVCNIFVTIFKHNTSSSTTSTRRFGIAGVDLPLIGFSRLKAKISDETIKINLLLARSRDLWASLS